jgi:hypothetical protein
LFRYGKIAGFVAAVVLLRQSRHRRNNSFFHGVLNYLLGIRMIESLADGTGRRSPVDGKPWTA